MAEAAPPLDELSRGNPPPTRVATYGLRVVALDPQRDPRWEGFVAHHPDGLIYHHPRWLEVIGRAYRLEPLGLALEAADGQLEGVLPLFRTYGPLSAGRLSSLPHTPLAGPLARGEAACRALVTAALERTRAEPGLQLELKSATPSLETLVGGLSVFPWDPTYVLALPERQEALHFGGARNHARIKWAAGRAAKLGVQVRSAEEESELRAWYRLYLDTMRWHVVPPRPYRFFALLWTLLRPYGMMKLLLAEQGPAWQRRLLAGSIFLMFNRTTFYAFNGRRSEDLPLRPNDAIQVHALQEAWRGGFRAYDFGEVERYQRGLAEFKRKWGAEPRPLYRYYNVEAGALPVRLAHRSSVVRQLSSPLWRHLPLGVTAALGRWLYRGR